LSKLVYKIFVVKLAFFKICMLYKTNLNLPRTRIQIWIISRWNTYDCAYFISYWKFRALSSFKIWETWNHYVKLIFLGPCL